MTAFFFPHSFSRYGDQHVFLYLFKIYFLLIFHQAFYRLFQKQKILENTHVEMVLLGNNPIVVNTENVLSIQRYYSKITTLRVSLRSILAQLIIQGNIFCLCFSASQTKTSVLKVCSVDKQSYRVFHGKGVTWSNRFGKSCMVYPPFENLHA